MMKMKQAVVVFGVAALGVVQSGCADPCDVAGNGKKEDLNFGVPFQPARGMQSQVVLNRWPPWLSGVFSTRNPETCYGYAESEIEVTLPDSLQSPPAVIDTTPGADVTVEFTCGAQTDAPQEVTVRLLVDGEVRHEDAFDIACHPVAQASVDVVPGFRGGGGGERFVVGGIVHIKPSMTDADGNPLSGFGVVPADQLLAALPRDKFPWEEPFRIAAAGALPELMVGPHRVQLDATFVPDSAWELSLEAFHTGEQDKRHFMAFPEEIGSGERLSGMEECEWTAVTSSESKKLDETACTFEHPSKLPGSNRTITRMCVKSLGREGCVDLF